MALQDIITAITAQADREITALRAAHEERVRALRAKHEQALGALRSDTSAQIETRKTQLLLKMKTHASIERRNRVASGKQAVINAAFAEALAALSMLPEPRVEPLLRACLRRIKGHGVLHASKRHEALLRKIAPSEQFTMGETLDASGGFRFTGKTSEADFTFEHLVHGVLRPMKELEISRLLFSA